MDWKVNSGYALIFSSGMLWGTIGLFVKQMEESGSTPAITCFLCALLAANRAYGETGRHRAAEGDQVTETPMRPERPASWV